MTKSEIKRHYEVKEFNVDDVVKIYHGNLNGCMCGCSGTYVYNPLNDEYIEKHEGNISDYQYNIKKLKRRLNEFYNSYADVDIIEGYIFKKAISLTKQIVVYLKEK